MACGPYEGMVVTKKLFFLKKAPLVPIHTTLTKTPIFIWIMVQIGPVSVHFGHNLDFLDASEVTLAAILNLRGHQVQNKSLNIKTTDSLRILV